MQILLLELTLNKHQNIILRGFIMAKCIESEDIFWTGIMIFKKPVYCIFFIFCPQKKIFYSVNCYGLLFNLKFAVTLPQFGTNLFEVIIKWLHLILSPLAATSAVIPAMDFDLLFQCDVYSFIVNGDTCIDRYFTFFQFIHPDHELYAKCVCCSHSPICYCLIIIQFLSLI